MRIFMFIITLFLLPILAFSSDTSVSSVLIKYQQQGAKNINAENGRLLWQKKYISNNKPFERSCTTCHGKDIQSPGKHVRSGKEIEPMSKKINPSRLTDKNKIAKWFKRNCKWTMGRECTAQEKADIVAFISNRIKF